jgi:hypothetical protein
VEGDWFALYFRAVWRCEQDRVSGRCGGVVVGLVVEMEGDGGGCGGRGESGEANCGWGQVSVLKEHVDNLLVAAPVWKEWTPWSTR